MRSRRNFFFQSRRHTLAPMRKSASLSRLDFSVLLPTDNAQSQLPLMPMPASVQQGAGQLLIDRNFSVAVTGFHDASLDRGIKRFQTQLSAQTGIPLRPKTGAAPLLQIHADHAREKIQKLGEDESYELTVADSGAKLTRAHSARHPARAANVSSAGAAHRDRIRSTRGFHQRPATLSLARD